MQRDEDRSTSLRPSGSDASWIPVAAIGGVPVEGVSVSHRLHAIRVGGVEVTMKAVEAACWHLPPRQWAEAIVRLAKERKND